MIRPRFSPPLKPYFVLMICAAALTTAQLQSCKNKDTAAVAGSTGYKSITVSEGGTITGRVTIRGERPVVQTLEVNHDNDACGTSHQSPRLICSASGGIKYAIVYLEDIREGAPLVVPTAPVLINQRSCAYEPHVQVVPIGATLSVQNNDRGVLHNVHLLLGDTTIWNQAQPMFEQMNTQVLRRAGLMHLRCDAGHVWMSGYVWVAQHPYVAVTDDSGAFVISSVPAGTYKLGCWHEGWIGTASRDPRGGLIGYTYDADHVSHAEVTVVAGKTTTVDFAIP